MRPYSSGGSVSAMVSPTWAAGIVPARLFQRDLGCRVLHLLHDQQMAEQAQLAALGIELGAHFRLSAVAGFGRLGDCVLHGGDDDAAIDRLLARNRVGDLQQFEFVGAYRHRRSPLFFCRAAGPLWPGVACSCPCPLSGSDARVLVVICFGAARRGLATTQRFGDQRVGEDEARLAHLLDWQQRLLAGVLAPDARRPSPSAPMRMPRKRLRPSRGIANSTFIT